MVTVFNKKDNGYIPTVLNDVHWEESQAFSSIRNGKRSEDSLFLIIPYTKNKNCAIQKGDIVIKGKFTNPIKSKTDLEPKGNAYTVTAVDFLDFGSLHMRHWEVTAR